MSWTQPGQGFLREVYLEEAIKLQWKETKRDNPQRFETTHKGQKITLDWQKGPPPGPKINLTGAHMHLKAWGLPGAQSKEAKEVANAVAKNFHGQRIITLNGKVVSTKVSGFKDRGPDDYTTYRPGWRKNWEIKA